ncbi:LamG-like jellyroll fold domain-containing protein, partial [Stieleria sp.]|uniref:LamG-like jellyroll fold domain-containing protein n=1 Tax=Stieleria sp. TaxID=2795976 RepID=UPI00356412B0
MVNDNPAGQPVTDYIDYSNFLTSPTNRAIGPRGVALKKLAPTTEPIHHRYEANNSALDVSGTRNGTPVGDATYGEGRTGGSAFLLDGAGDYFNLGNWAPADDWTIAAWVNPNSVPATGWVGLAGSQSSRRDWSISIYDGNYVAVFEFGQRVDSGIAASIGVWTHVAATLRDGIVHVYIDGVLRNSVAAPEYVPSTSGARLGSTTFDNAGFFDGRIDEVSIVERSVSDGEIVSLRDSGTLDPFNPQDRFLVTFDRPIDMASFGPDYIGISGPSTVSAVQVESVTRYSAVVTLSGRLSNAGTYVASIGPDVAGSAGTLMDQDADGVSGEPVDDVFQTSILIDTFGPRIVGQSPSGSTGTVLSSIDVTFNEPIDPDSLSVDDIQLFDPETLAALDAHDPAAIIDGFSVAVIESSNTFNGLSGALTVVDDSSRHAFKQFVNESVINYGSTVGNYAADQSVPLSGTDTNYIVLDANATITIPTAGKWTFSVGSDDGYRLDIGGRIGEFPGLRGLSTDLHVFDFPAAGDYPLRLIMFNQTGGLGFELAAAEGEISTFNAGTFALVGSSGGLSVKTNPVAPTSDIQILSVQPIDPSNTTFRISFSPQPSDGEYQLVVDPKATDLQGNLQDQDNDGIGGEPVEDRYISRITVARDPLRVVSQSPTTSINGAFENFTVTFNIPIDPNSFATTDARVIGPGGVVTVTSIEQVDATTYRVNVQRTTEDGNYQLFIGPDITDPAGN